MHICIERELKAGEYYLFCDVNYRFANKNGTTHNYNITSYAPKEVLLQNLTPYVKNISDIFQYAIYTFAKANGKVQTKNNCKVYVYSSFKQKLPFVIAAYENATSTNYKSTTNITYKGGVSGCVYCDDATSEKETKVVKDLKSGNINAVAIMRYTPSSLITITVGVSN